MEKKAQKIRLQNYYYQEEIKRIQKFNTYNLPLTQFTKILVDQQLELLEKKELEK